VVRLAVLLGGNHHILRSTAKAGVVVFRCNQRFLPRWQLPAAQDQKKPGRRSMSEMAISRQLGLVGYSAAASAIKKPWKPREKSGSGRKECSISFSNLEHPAGAMDGRLPFAGDGIRCPADFFSLPWGVVRVVLSNIGRHCLAVQKKVPSDHSVSLPEPSGNCHCVKHSLTPLT